MASHSSRKRFYFRTAPANSSTRTAIVIDPTRIVIVGDMEAYLRSNDDVVFVNNGTGKPQGKPQVEPQR